MSKGSALVLPTNFSVFTPRCSFSTSKSPGLMEGGGGGGRGRPSFMARVASLAALMAEIKSSCCCLQFDFFSRPFCKGIRFPFRPSEHIPVLITGVVLKKTIVRDFVQIMNNKRIPMAIIRGSLSSG